MRPVPAHLASFWAAVLQSHGPAANGRFYEAFFFGDNEALANELAGLVLRGAKRATAESAWVFDAQGKQVPQPGDLSIVTDWAGRPLCVIETESVEVVPFRAVGADFAAAEGEGDGSLQHWRAAHRQYFTRGCARIGRQFDEGMPVICERFKLVYAAWAGAAGQLL